MSAIKNRGSQMSDEANNPAQTAAATTVIVQNNTSNALGITSSFLAYTRPPQKTRRLVKRDVRPLLEKSSSLELFVVSLLECIALFLDVFMQGECSEQ